MDRCWDGYLYTGTVDLPSIITLHILEVIWMGQLIAFQHETTTDERAGKLTLQLVRRRGKPELHRLSLRFWRFSDTQSEPGTSPRIWWRDTLLSWLACF